ncbi:MAG: uroporphyrinogen-III C-methyltransferase [Gammaproteobacteria bacterium]
MTDEFTPSAGKGRRPWPAAVPTAVMVAALAFGLWAAYGAREARERADIAERNLDARITELAGEAAGRTGQDRQVAAAIDTLAERQSALERRVEGLYSTRRGGLLAAEAEHMVRLAAQRLALLQDPAGALALLAAADAAIRDIRDADTHAVRAAIAADSAALGAAGRLDVEVLYLRLAALPEQAERIAAQGRTGKTPEEPVAAAQEPAPPQALDWRSRAGAALSSLITVRRVDQRLDPMITDGERALAAQNFRLLVEHAQAALLQRRTGIYTSSLAQAEAWLTRMAGGDPMLRAALRRELTTLRTVDMDQPLPDLTASLAATRALVVRLTPESGDTP